MRRSKYFQIFLKISIDETKTGDILYNIIKSENEEKKQKKNSSKKALDERKTAYIMKA